MDQAQLCVLRHSVSELVLPGTSVGHIAPLHKDRRFLALQSELCNNERPMSAVVWPCHHVVPRVPHLHRNRLTRARCPRPPQAVTPRNAVFSVRVSCLDGDQDEDVKPRQLPIVAVEDFRATRAGQVDLHRGDRVICLDNTDAVWWRGSCRGRVGLFPADAVEPQS